MRDHGVLPVSAPLPGEHLEVAQAFAARDGQLLGAIAVPDTVQSEARQAMDVIHAMGIRTVLLTGDAKAVADIVAKQLNIDEVAAKLLPEDKRDRVKRLVASGRKVAMMR